MVEGLLHSLSLVPKTFAAQTKSHAEKSLETMEHLDIHNTLRSEGEVYA